MGDRCEYIGSKHCQSTSTDQYSVKGLGLDCMMYLCGNHRDLLIRGGVKVVRIEPVIKKRTYETVVKKSSLGNPEDWDWTNK